MNRNEVLEKFYLEEKDNLVRRINRRAETPENAEDIVQEAFARALKYWPSYEGSDKPLIAWFSTILNNALRDFKREERMYGMNEELDEEQIEPIDTIPRDFSLVRLIRQEIESKEGVAKEVLRLYYVYQYTPRDITAVTEQKNSTVRQIIWRFNEDIKGKYGT